MKTKMKSAFAFIAVALMIMVAVVPMVGVFTEDSSADAVAIPGTGKITIKGNVKDTSGIIAGAMVKVTVDSNAIYGITDNSGNYSIDVYIDAAKDIDVEVVVGEDEMYAKVKGVADAKNPVQSNDGRSFSIYNFKEVTVNLEKIDFVSGYVAVSGSLKYASGQAYTKETEITYVTGVTAEDETGTSGSNSATSIDGKYTILVPANSKDVVIKADAIEAKTDKFDVTTSSAPDKDLKASKLNLSEITVTGIPAGITSDVKVDRATDSVVSNISSLVVGKDGKIAFEYTLEELTEGKNKKVKITDDKGYGAPYEVAVANTLTYNCVKFITGTIKMGDVLSLESTPEVKLCKEDKTEVESLSVDNVINGTYYAPFGNKTISADVKQVRAFVGSETDKVYGEKFTPFTSGKTTVDIKLDDKKFSLIDGTIKCGSSPVQNVEIDLSSSTAEIVGKKDGKVYTDTNGKYKFYAETGKAVTIAPVGNFDVASRTFTATKTTIDFNMKTIELEGKAVTDATGNALKDVEVFYKIGETGAYNTTAIKTDKDGKFKITVNSNVSADDVLVYFKDAKYTFNSNDKEPFALSSTEEKDWKANEQTYTFTLADAKGVAIESLTGITVSVAKYKIHTAGSSVVYDGTDGAAITAVNGVYSFIGLSDYMGKTEEYRDVYCVKVTTATSSTKYTFTEITEYAENLVIKANEYTLTGFVKDAAGDKAVNGATVASTIASTTSNVKGYFGILVKTEDKITVTGGSSGYTFSTDAIKTAGEKEITIKANEKTFTGTLKDADGKAITTGTYTIKVMKGSDQIGANATVKADGTFTIVTAVAEGYKLVAVDTTTSGAVRTFADITLKGTETTLDVVSEQATYSGKVYLADGTTAVGGITVNAYKTSATQDDSTPIKTATTATDGSYTMLLNVADEKAYVVKATDAADTIKFSTTGIAFKDYVADIKSTTKITDAGVGSLVTIKDADSKALGAGYVVKVYDATTEDVEKYKLVGTYTTDDKGQFRYYNQGGVTYKFAITSPAGSLYTFDKYAVLVGDTINAKEKTYDGTLKSKNNVAIPDATISFLDKDGKVLTTAKTDADGNWTATYNELVVKKITANTSKYGAITLDLTVVPGDLNLKISEYIYSGLYANGETISGVVVVFEMKNGSTFIQMGKAAIVDDKYYVVADNEFATGYTMTVSATASNFNAYGTYAAGAVAMNLDVGKKPGVVSIATDDVFFGEFYTVYNATNAQVGDKIILRASEVAYKPLEDGNETTVVKYKFNGWYVNGVKVSDDLEYVYTVTEDCLVYADYKASTYETASDDNGISPSVLVIGIAAVIVALIAVVYTVIQKKE